MSNANLNDYPPGIQDLLYWAAFHLTQLEKLEREFLAWQEAQAGTKPAQPNRAELARQRWEALTRTVPVTERGVIRG